MTKQEMLYEQYNDALFRLLMHSVAQHQGQQYQEENQALKAQEGGPSETAKRRCLRTISRQVRRGHARAAARPASAKKHRTVNGGRYAAGHFLPDGCVRRVTRFPQRRAAVGCGNLRRSCGVPIQPNGRRCSVSGHRSGLAAGGILAGGK